ncbi:hypothetical protein FH972_021971 [Carpinus fangiana]|uniref:Chromosome segregation in meiosis protein 3 domain-containing protein n=1 Tax=Carpinus fangiana TaxID=176857 RepID=A0A5N6KQW2_9ROSI|nr:hypothetical protein FH972_021971 [Carpinus fangiana]
MSRSTVAAHSHRAGYAGREAPLQDSRDTNRWDELDAILNDGPDEASQPDQARTQEPTTQRSTWRGSNAGADGLGIDEEVKVRKARAPTAKLDEERLLSVKGIPKLRKITKERLKFKGKGHEFSDVARMLNVYQLWLDDMFPKANFADGLSMIEKLGHKRRIQIMRREWIDEDKPNKGLTEQDIADRDAARLEGVVQENASQDAAVQAAQAAQHRQSQEDAAGSLGASDAINGNGHAEIQEPDEDELDALLAENDRIADAAPKQTASSRPLQAKDHLSEDDMDAMDAMGDDWFALLSNPLQGQGDAHSNGKEDTASNVVGHSFALFGCQEKEIHASDEEHYQTPKSKKVDVDEVKQCDERLELLCFLDESSRWQCWGVDCVRSKRGIKQAKVDTQHGTSNVLWSLSRSISDEAEHPHQAPFALRIRELLKLRRGERALYRFAQSQYALTQDDERKQAQALNNVRVLEGHGLPDRRDANVDHCFDASNDVPSNALKLNACKRYCTARVMRLAMSVRENFWPSTTPFCGLNDVPLTANPHMTPNWIALQVRSRTESRDFHAPGSDTSANALRGLHGGGDVLLPCCSTTNQQANSLWSHENGHKWIQVEQGTEQHMYRLHFQKAISHMVADPRDRDSAFQRSTSTRQSKQARMDGPCSSCTEPIRTQGPISYQLKDRFVWWQSAQYKLPYVSRLR